MEKVSIRVQSGAARFDVAIVAESAEEAIGLARRRYRNSNFRVRPVASPLKIVTDDHTARPNDLAA